MNSAIEPESSHEEPALRRLDHLVCNVPDIERYHSHFVEVLGFPEAWPIGRFWLDAQTSGIALGGINLEFVQADNDPPIRAAIDTLVFEPTSLMAAERKFASLGVRTNIREKIESNPDLLRLRGFTNIHEPQLICRNLELTSDFPIPMFLCEYSPFLKERLANIPTLHGKVTSIHGPWDVAKIAELGYLGDIEFVPSPTIAIKLENGPLFQKGLDPGFWFI